MFNFKSFYLVLISVIPLFVNTCFSQMSTSKNISLNKFSIKEKTDTVNSTRFSLGIGVASPLGSGDVSVLINGNVNFHIYKSVFLDLGYEAYELYKQDDKFTNALYLAPNLNVNYYKNKLSFFGGIGVYIFIPTSIGFEEPGILFIARNEYNIISTYSIGIEVKHVRFSSAKRRQYPFYAINLYFSIKL